MDVITLVVIALAVARLSIVITTDIVFHKVREFIYLRWPPPGRHDGVEWFRVQRLSKKDWKTRKEIYQIETASWDGPDALDAPVKPERFIKHPYIVTRPHMIGELVSCNWCISIWLGGVAALAYYFSPEVTFWVALPFALSMAALVAIDRGTD